LSLARSASQDENWCGRRVAAGSRADGRRAGRQPLGSGWPVRRRLTRRPRRGSRAAPARQPVVRRTMPTSSRFASATPRSSDRRMVAREGGDGGFRSPGAGICRRLLGGGVDRGQPGPSRRSSVVHLRALRASAAAAVNMALCHRPIVFPRPWASREAVASPCNVESGRFAAARGRPNPGSLPTARPPRPAVAHLRLGARPRQGRRRVTRSEACYPRMGTV
jgi:hypothetical protein